MYITKGCISIDVSDIGKNKILDSLSFFLRLLENDDDLEVMFLFDNSNNAFDVKIKKGQYEIFFVNREMGAEYGANEYGYLYLNDINDVFDLCAELCDVNDLKSLNVSFKDELPF